MQRVFRHGAEKRPIKSVDALKKRIRVGSFAVYVAKFACFRSRLPRIAELPPYTAGVFVVVQYVIGYRSRAISRGAISHRGETPCMCIYIYIANRREIRRKLENVAPATKRGPLLSARPDAPVSRLRPDLSVRFRTRARNQIAFPRFASPDAPEWILRQRFSMRTQRNYLS